ncbi:hypothetical protein Y695_01598 [Hydrogenophaga sp. T4]|nr:hypothetical protein Y695_01598 [Hydrogenophaga sp. T4]
MTRTEAALDRAAKVDLAHIRARSFAPLVRKVLHIDHAQAGVLQREFLVPIAQRRRATDHARHLERLGRPVDGHRPQIDARPTIVKTGLVDVDAAVAGGMVHFNPRGLLLARFVVVDHDVAGKQPGHAGVVVLDNEFLEFDRKRQILQQHAIGLGQDRGARRGALGHQQVAPERRVAGRKAVLRGHIGNQAATRERRLAVEPHLGTHHQIAIEQATEAHQHNRAVCRQIADLVGRSRLGGHHPAGTAGAFPRLQLDLPAGTQQGLTDAVGR